MFIAGVIQVDNGRVRNSPMNVIGTRTVVHSHDAECIFAESLGGTLGEENVNGLLPLTRFEGWRGGAGFAIVH